MADAAPLQTRRSPVFADLRARILSAIVLGVAAVGTLLVGGLAFILFWLAASLAMNWEWQRMVGPDRLGLRAVVGGAALCVAAVLCVQLAPDLAWLVVFGGAFLTGLLGARDHRLWSAAGVIYAGVLIVCVLTVRPAFVTSLERPFDLRTIVWLFAVVWGTDVMAYFGGRLIGGPKVWPAVSPGKTWSGTLVGIACGALAGLAVGLINSVMPISTWPVIAIGLAAAAAAQVGDFFESGIKRRFGVKDSSNLIPGHGGVMDRLDGFVAAAGLIVLVALIRDASSVGEAVFRW